MTENLFDKFKTNTILLEIKFYISKGLIFTIDDEHTKQYLLNKR